MCVKIKKRSCNTDIMCYTKMYENVRIKIFSYTLKVYTIHTFNANVHEEQRPS